MSWALKAPPQPRIGPAGEGLSIRAPRARRNTASARRVHLHPFRRPTESEPDDDVPGLVVRREAPFSGVDWGLVVQCPGPARASAPTPSFAVGRHDRIVSRCCGADRPPARCYTPCWQLYGCPFEQAGQVCQAMILTAADEKRIRKTSDD